MGERRVVVGVAVRADRTRLGNRDRHRLHLHLWTATARILPLDTGDVAHETHPGRLDCGRFAGLQRLHAVDDEAIEIYYRRRVLDKVQPGLYRPCGDLVLFPRIAAREPGV